MHRGMPKFVLIMAVLLVVFTLLATEKHDSEMKSKTYPTKSIFGMQL